jgi:hypothetical protein
MRCCSCGTEIEPDPDLGKEQLCDACFERIEKRMEPIEQILCDGVLMCEPGEHVFEMDGPPPWKCTFCGHAPELTK